jgi:hypothetical protein
MFNHRFTIKTALTLLLVAVIMNASMLVQSAIAQPAAQINYQGKLTDGSGVAVPDGAYNMRFWLLQSTNQATTSAVWNESLTGTEQVSVVNGLFSVMLGSTSPLTAVDFNQPLYLGIEIGGTSGTPTWDGEMLPRKPLGTVPAAFEAYQVGGVASSSLLRSDQADTATGLLTFSNGIISTASSTISDLTFSTATGTTLVLGDEQFTDFTGTGLVNEAGVLSVSSSSLNISLEGLTDVTAMTKDLGDLLYWNGTEWADIATSSLGIDTTADNLADNSLEELQDVATMTKTLGDLLYWNGTEWADIATSSLGLGNGTFLGLSDTPASYTANRIMFTNAGGTALTDTANFVFDGTNLGIGTSSPSSRLTVAGNAWLDSNVISFASSSASSLLLQYFAEATSTIKDNSAFAFTIATSTTASPIFRIDTSGAYPNTLLSGSFNVNNGAIAYDAATDQTTIQNLALGSLSFGDDAGVVSWTDIGITSAAATGTAMSYTASLDGNPLLTVYGEADGLGGLQNSAIGVGTTSPWARFSVIGNSIDATKPLLTIASSTGSTLFHITHDGKVGIGTTTPSSRLTVDGSTEISGNITLPNSTNKITLGNFSNISGSFDMALGMNVDTSLISGMDFKNSNTSGQVRLLARNDQDDYLVMNTFGSGNTATFFGQQGRYISSIFSQGANDTDKMLAIGTYNAGDFILGTQNTERMRITSGGNVGIGTTSPTEKLEINGKLKIGSNTVSGENVTFDGSTSAAMRVTNQYGYISMAPLNAGGAHIYTDRAVFFFNKTLVPVRAGFSAYSTESLKFYTNSGTSLAMTIATGTNNVGIGTSSPTAKLTLETTGFSGAGTVGINQYLQTENSVNGAVQFGNNFYLHASNTATTTLVGSMLRIKDDTTFANTVRGLEIQTNRGVNTYGENTALSAFARTFGVRAVTSGDAGAVFEPAAGFFETEGTTQGNAMRGYSDTITTASLLALFHSSSTFAGTGLEMNFGNGAGSFSSSTSKYLDFQNGGNSVFTVSAFGTTTIGDGTTNNMASLQIGFGGICVDNDGSCTATSTGWVVADGFAAGNSDLAEMYFSRTALQTGELVMMTGSLSVDRATKDSTLPILGVVSTKPGLTIGSDDTSLTAGEQAYPIALSGRVPVKLSNENGPIKRGDALMLSTLPGVAMKATATGTTIGIALEDFDEERLYSETYVNQFGDDLVDPVYEPIFTVYDARIDDGCYYSGGNAVGEAPCIPLSATTSAAMVAEANEIAEEESVAKQLQALRDAQSEVEILADGRAVQVGQLVMFVEKGYRWLDNAQMAALGVLVATSSVSEQGENEEETLFDRLVALANRFVDGVLSVFTLKAERVETSELCVDGVCIDAAALRQLLEGTEQSASPAALVPEEPSGPAVSENPPPTPDSTEDVSTDIEMSSTTEETSPTTSEESTEQPSTNSDEHEIIEPIEEQNDSAVTTEESEEVAIEPAEASFSEAETESETILPESVAPIAEE